MPAVYRGRIRVLLDCVIRNVLINAAVFSRARRVATAIENATLNEKPHELSHALHDLQVIHAPNKRLRALGSKYGGYQAASFPVHSSRIERTLLCAGRVLREVAHSSPIAEKYLDFAAAGRRRIHQCAIRNELHAAFDGQDLRILHSLIRVARVERQTAVNQRYGDQVLTVDVRHRPIINNAGAVLGERDNNAVDISRREGVFAPKKQEGVERRLDWVPDGKRFDCGLGDEETGTEAVDHFTRARL